MRSLSSSRPLRVDPGEHPGEGERAPPGLARPAHPLGIGRRHPDHAEVVQPPLGGHGHAADARPRDADVALVAGVHAVAQQDHVEVLGDGVDAVRQRRVGRRREHVVDPGELQHVRGMPAAAPLHVVRVQDASVEHGEGVLDRHRLVEAVGVERDLDVVLVGHAQGGVDRPQGRAGVLVHLQSAHVRADRLADGLVARRRSPSEQADVHGVRLHRPQPALEHPRRPQAHSPHRPGLLADDGGDARRDLRLEHPWAERVDVGVDAPGRGDQPVAVDDHGARADDDVDVVGRVGVAGLADAADAALADADARDPHAVDGIEHDDVRDEHVARLARGQRLEPHAVASGLREPDADLLALRRRPARRCAGAAGCRRGRRRRPGGARTPGS